MDVGEVVVGVRGVRDEEVSSRAKRSPKTLAPFSRKDSKGAVSKAYCPDSRCTPQAGMRKTTAAQSMELVWREEEDLLMCLSGEERPPFYRRKRRRREAAPGAEGNAGDETNRQQPKGAAFVFNIHYSKNFPAPE